MIYLLLGLQTRAVRRSVGALAADMHRGVSRYLPTVGERLARNRKYLLIYLLFGDVETESSSAR